MNAITRDTLLDTAQAFKRSSLLKAAIELKLFDTLAAGPLDAAKVAAALGAGPRGIRILLGGLASIGLLDSDGVRFSLPEGADRFLVTTSDEYSGAVVDIATSAWEWDNLRDLAGVIRDGSTRGKPNTETPGFGYWRDFAGQTTFITHASAKTMTQALTPWADGRERLRLLDVGCGHALFGLLFAQAFGQAEVSALDWENVLPFAREQADRLGLADRLTCLPGDAFTVPLNGPYDLVVLANLLLMFSPERSTRLLRRVADVLEPGGRIAIAGFTVSEVLPETERPAHLLSLTMLAGTTGGETHSVESYQRMLQATGFSPASVHRVANLPFHVLVAEKPR